MSPDYEEALRKLRWGAEIKDWSVDLEPGHCRALLQVLEMVPLSARQEALGSDAMQERPRRRRSGDKDSEGQRRSRGVSAARGLRA